jgi:hypothetical protein
MLAAVRGIHRSIGTVGIRKNFLSTERTPLCSPLPSPLRLGTSCAVNAVPTKRAEFGVFADATRTIRAFHAPGEGQSKPDGAEQTTKAKPQAAACPSVVGNNCSADTE